MPALVAAGCSVDATDDARNTPLHLAAGCGFVDTVRALTAVSPFLSPSVFEDLLSCTVSVCWETGYWEIRALQAACLHVCMHGGSSGRPTVAALNCCTCQLWCDQHSVVALSAVAAELRC
jgi:ankyrin repeat protein